MARKSPPKQAAENTAPELSREDRIFNQGLYSAYVSTPPQSAAGSFLAKLNLATYAPIAIGFWVLAYFVVASGLLSYTHSALMGLGLVFSGLSIAAIFALFRPQAGLGAWPANRTAAMVLALMILDFWAWIFNRPFEGLYANIFLGIDIIGFAALLFSVSMFVYGRLHIELMIRVLSLKAFFDFAAYVLTGGFGIPMLNGIGVTHPLHQDALFTVAMLELWGLMVYLLKYRAKINQLQE